MSNKKHKSAFFCQNCGSQSPKWLGKCPTCDEWNTFVEERISKEKGVSTNTFKKDNIPTLINKIVFSNEKRIDSNNLELNRVLGGGIVKGSVVLIGGDPGIGKSPLILQMSLMLSNITIIYVS